MKGFHEECLRLSAKALQSQLTAQDFNEASLWFGMVGQHFQETNIDIAIRSIAEKVLNRMQMTGIPLDYTAAESELTKELSMRVGWNVGGQVHPIFESDFNEDLRRLRHLSTSGISSNLIETAKLISQIPTQINLAKTALPSEFPHIVKVSSSGSSSSNIVSQICSKLATSEDYSLGAAGFFTVACLAGIIDDQDIAAFVEDFFAGELTDPCSQAVAAFGGISGITHFLHSQVCA